jgi:hypothetical protein
LEEFDIDEAYANGGITVVSFIPSIGRSMKSVTCVIGFFTVFYTGYRRPPGSGDKVAPGTPEMGFGGVGFVTVRLQPRN